MTAITSVRPRGFGITVTKQTTVLLRYNVSGAAIQGNMHLDSRPLQHLANLPALPDQRCMFLVSFCFDFVLFGGNLDVTDPLTGLLELLARRQQPSVGGTIKEGNIVHLVCEKNCNGSHQSYTWFKNGAPVRNGSNLDLGPVSPSDSGNYTCSLSNHPGTTSAAVHVDVECENRKQNPSFTKLISTRRLMPNVSFQTGPRTREPVRWGWIVAQMSPWSARALQTPPLRVTSGLESWTGSRRLETSLRGSPVRAESISAELQTTTEVRTHLSSWLRSKVSLSEVSRQNFGCIETVVSACNHMQAQ